MTIGWVGSLSLLTVKTKKNNNKPRAKQETAQPTAARFLKKNNKPKAEQETAQPTAARLKKTEGKTWPAHAYGCAVNKAEWLWSSINIKGANKDAQI